MLPSAAPMVHPDSHAEPQRWVGLALAALLLVSLALRTWDASQGLNPGRHFDERIPLKNISGLLLHGELRPRHAFYPSLSYLPQAGVLAASEWLYQVTRYQPFSIFNEGSDGYSPTAYWLCRMVNVIYGILSLWFLYLIGRRLYSPEVGLLAAAILAAFPRHLMSSAEFKPDILAIFLVTLTFYWTLAAAARPTLRRFLLVGFGVGLGVSTKYTAVASALPITAAVLTEGRHDRRQWLWLVLAGVASVVTFVALNPFLDVVFEFIPVLVHGYAAKGVVEKSNHWVVFERQVQFLIEHHGPVVAAFVALGVAGLLWRIFRPAPDDPPQQRLGSILALSILVGYSVIHALGMTLFRGQNYLPVVPFSSLAAAWAMIETWRILTARLPWLAWRPAAALVWLSVGAALVAQQGTNVYYRLVPTTFERINHALLLELDPLGVREVAYEKALGEFDTAGKPRRPLLTRVDRLTALPAAALDRTDVEIFPESRLDGADGAAYRARMARLAKSQVEIVGDRWFQSRGESIVVLHHPWQLAGDPVDVPVRRPDGDQPYLVGRFPDGVVKPGETVSLVVWIPREAEDPRASGLQLDPGGRTVPVFDTGRRLNRFFRTSPRFTLTGQELRVRIPSEPDDRPRGFGLELHPWRPAAAPARP